MPESSPAYDRFLRSMNLGYDEWHDGVGYDLDALSEMTPQERDEARGVLAGRARKDWRDVEALAALAGLGVTSAAGDLRRGLDGDDLTTRCRAAKTLHARGEMPDIDRFIADELRKLCNDQQMTAILGLAERHPTDAVRRTLLWCVKNRRPGSVHYAALLYYMAGLAAEAFDWDHRPFFLCFADDSPAVDAKAAFGELCEKLGVDPADVA